MNKFARGLVGLLLFGAASAGEVAPSLSLGVTFPAPEQPEQRRYLGLPADAAEFSLTDIEADWLVVDAVDMYCHVCQQSAPAVRRLYEALQAAGVGDQVRFLGIGLNNSPLETRTFARRYKLPFPVVPDQPGQLRKLFPRLRASTLIVLRRKGEGHQIFARHKGLLRKKDADALAKKIIAALRDSSTDSDHS